MSALVVARAIFAVRARDAVSVAARARAPSVRDGVESAVVRVAARAVVIAGRADVVRTDVVLIVRGRTVDVVRAVTALSVGRGAVVARLPTWGVSRGAVAVSAVREAVCFVVAFFGVSVFLRVLVTVVVVSRRFAARDKSTASSAVAACKTSGAHIAAKISLKPFIPCTKES